MSRGSAHRAILALMRAGFGLPADLPPSAFPGRQPRSAAEDLASADPHEIVEVARAHRMMQALSPGFDTTPALASLVDPDLVLFFAEMRAASRRRNAALAQILAELGAGFAEAGPAMAGHGAVVLKGGAELVDPFDGPGGSDGRFVGDLDILLTRDAAEETQARLIEAGWRPEESPEINLGRQHHLPALSRPDRPGQIELHYRVGGPELDAVLPAAAVIARAVPSGLPGILLPARVDRVAHLVVHGQASDAAWAEGRLRFCDVMDLGRIVRGSQAEGVELLAAARRMAVEAGQGDPVDGLIGAAHRILPECLADPAKASPRAQRWSMDAVARIGETRAQQRRYLLRSLRERLVALFTDAERRAHWRRKLSRKGGFASALLAMRKELGKRS